ncbi:MAG: trypsin-like peptidase domain-containing protein [Acidobacteria bacterium]|nr:trypsin-like peptidase domain-containing protein [Acidobacteriota bacterium]
MPVLVTVLTGPQAGRRRLFDQPEIRLGRASDNDFVFDPSELRASAHHAVIEGAEGQYFIKDLDSTNGIYIGEKQISRGLLTSGGVLEFGRMGPRLLFEVKSQEDLLLSPADTDPGSRAKRSAPLPPEPRSQLTGDRSVPSVVETVIRHASNEFRRSPLWISVIVIAAVLSLGYLAFLRGGSGPHPDGLRPNPEFSDMVARNQRAVALIQVQFDLLDERGRLMSEGSSEGTGFAADQQGHIVTNAHIVRPWAFDDALGKSSSGGQVRSIKVIFADRSAEDALEARVVIEDVEHDLAILTIPPRPGLPAVEGFNADLSGLRQGDEVVFLGFPLGTDLLNSTHQDRATTTLVRTTVSKVTPTLLQIDAPVYKGFSGSPIIDRGGRVVGVLTARIAEAGEEGETPSRTIGVATPIGYALELLSRVRAGR